MLSYLYFTRFIQYLHVYVFSSLTRFYSVLEELSEWVGSGKPTL